MGILYAIAVRNASSPPSHEWRIRCRQAHFFVLASEKSGLNPDRKVTAIVTITCELTQNMRYSCSVNIACIYMFAIGSVKKITAKAG